MQRDTYVLELDRPEDWVLVVKPVDHGKQVLFSLGADQHREAHPLILCVYGCETW